MIKGFTLLSVCTPMKITMGENVTTPILVPPEIYNKISFSFGGWNIQLL